MYKYHLDFFHIPVKVLFQMNISDDGYRCDAATPKC